MKFTAFCLLLFVFSVFTGCMGHTNTKLVTKGTPSRADTVMPHPFAPHQEAAHTEKNVDRVFLR